MKHRSPILLGLIALVLLPTVWAANPCTTGGAPVMRDGSGVGGTGMPANSADGSGQGGTGIILSGAPGGDGSGTGGTGRTVEVEGVITGFASICVNGLELHYQPSTPVTIRGKTATARDLGIGQVVRALARGQGDQLAVQSVHVRHFLVAPLQEVGTDKLRALGRSISLSPDAIVPSSLVPGVKVAVSGFIGAHGQSIATRLDVVPDDTPDSLTGKVQRNASGKLSIDGIALDGRLNALEPGDIVRAEGRYAQGRMQITRFERDERTMPVDRIVIQGLVRHADKSGLNIGGQRFLIDAKTQGRQTPPRVGEWAIIDATREDEHFHVRKVETQDRPVANPDKSGHRKDESSHTGLAEKSSKQAHEPPSGEGAGHPDREVARPNKAEAPEPIERPETFEKPEKVETPEKVERPEPIERPEKIERPEPIERPERIERPEPIERPERIERPEPIERVERVERPEHND